MRYLVILLLILFIIALWIIIFDSNRFVIRTYTFSDARIKKKQKAIMISDLHNKKYGKDNEVLLDAIRKQKPDYILVGGDLMIAEKKGKLDTAITFVTQLHKEFPVYYANGNHEHRLEHSRSTYGDMADRYEKALSEIGLSRIVNDRVNLQEYGISIVGSQIDRIFYKKFRVQVMHPKYLENLLGKPEKDLYTILLAHNPDYFPIYSKWGADLVLSGHVHGGIARVPFWGKGILSPRLVFFPKYDGGLFKDGKSSMVVSRGLGMHTLHMRFWNPGELVVLELNPMEQTLEQR